MSPAPHHLSNRLQTGLLIAVLLGISALAGGILLGVTGIWMALGTSLIALLIEPMSSSQLTLALYRGRPLSPAEIPQLWAILEVLAHRAQLPSCPRLYRIPSHGINAFALGHPQQASIVLTHGLLQTLNQRELTAVLAHEIAHIAHKDIRVMGLADYVSRLTHLMAIVGQLTLVFSLPWALAGQLDINWGGLLILIFSPHLALLAQLGLSRTREFAADRSAAQWTGDPQGLASALIKIDRIRYGLRTWVLPGWGHPEPSWLRTHPTTEERIQRLLAPHHPLP